LRAPYFYPTFLDAATVLGANRTLQKPIRMRDLLTTVQELFAET